LTKMSGEVAVELAITAAATAANKKERAIIEG
jgi:hypothetical protein